MKIRYMSDLHLEFDGRNEWVPPAVPDDADAVLVLAGDIDVDKHATRLARRVAGHFRAVVQICGNHEYYKGGSPVRLIDKLRDTVSDLTNVHLLENGTITVGDVRFIGATLWSDFNWADPASMQLAREQMNDFKRIRTGSVKAPYSRAFSPSDAIRIHLQSRAFIREELEQARAAGQKAVVVTHCRLPVFRPIRN
ncbi:putative phosphodiesterase [Natronocella acetinitrilica]|uniref:Phosphodiesterase n=1 Tax=Natronocella acetinitrilica TaxID=414046 RepID=A0AAE3G7E5_9GAMM|nr:metallophosphoesterase [Natronocella acetinitrilica]MCP1677205.1 putative phosphodiesterase [Natronocella acetinitrilica]